MSGVYAPRLAGVFGTDDDEQKGVVVRMWFEMCRGTDPGDLTI
jgi:hypothetical protein